MTDDIHKYPGNLRQVTVTDDPGLAYGKIKEAMADYAKRFRSIEWIPVAERKPSNDRWVLAYSQRDGVDLANYEYGRWYRNAYEGFEPIGPTHWAELPEPPEQ